MQLPAFIDDHTIEPREYHRRLREWCRMMRASHPVAYDDESKTWLVSRYEDVVRVQSDYTTFSSEHSLNRERRQVVRRDQPSIIELDPPRHRQMRSLITASFSARTIAEMAPQIERIVDELLDKAITEGHVEWMDSFANPLPVMVISDMLGMPRAKWRQFKEWNDALTIDDENGARASEAFTEYFEQSIEERRRQPRNDILSLLINSEVDGERLSHDELMGFCFTLFIAGNITTTSILGNALLCFDANPQTLTQLKERPEIVPSAVEEIIRYMPPFRAGLNDLVLGRVAKRDVEIGGELIQKGAYVQINRLSANFDEQVFPDAERFDIERNPNKHQSFGHGVHFCIGAPLARLETKIALTKLAERVKKTHIVEGEPLEQVRHQLLFGLKRLPIYLEV
ncbi:cytochrome P450 [Ktedonospora formicarum]|uniref:Putative cytochrome P450 YjiB n=1 Tax=Ktedonospora formicarum TaxID=2778364 RepID=A0A8J3MWX5_9CHLR|nr:cytochrome P450 [Ktedonospora formicarum]GHO49421.1 putative cytochrome P450 YjiB [Ktedonospora formicarum]